MAGVNRARLRELIEERGTTARALSRAVGSPESPNDYLVRDILSGKSKNPRTDTLSKIADELKVNYDELLLEPTGVTREADPRRVPTFLPVRYRVKAGAWFEVGAEEPIVGVSYPAVPDPDFAEWPQWLELVVGDSMNLVVPDKHLVHVVDALEMGYAPRTGDYVVVERRRDDGATRERTVKEVEVLPDGTVRLWPRSTNPKWADPVLLREGARDGEDIEVCIVGYVVGSYNPTLRKRGRR